MFGVNVNPSNSVARRPAHAAAAAMHSVQAMALVLMAVFLLSSHLPNYDDKHATCPGYVLLQAATAGIGPAGSTFNHSMTVRSPSLQPGTALVPGLA